MNQTAVNQTSNQLPTTAQRIAYVSICAVLIALMFVTVATWTSRHLFVGEILNNFRFQILLLTFLVSMIHYIQGSRCLAGICGIVSVVTFVPIASQWFPTDQPPTGPQKFSLLSYNVYGENSDREPVVAKILEHVPDIVVVLEYENSWEQTLTPLAQSYTHSLKVPRWHGFGIALFSRFPIENARVVQITKTVTDNPIIVAEINSNEQAFVVVASHFLSPLSAQKMEIRNQQIAEVADIIAELQAAQNLPVVFVGDFNCVAWSPFLQDAMKRCRLRDSRKGFGYQGSWPTHNSFMQIPIDNALVSQQIHVHQRSILSSDTSDHFPLYLEFSINDD